MWRRLPPWRPGDRQTAMPGPFDKVRTLILAVAALCLAAPAAALSAHYLPAIGVKADGSDMLLEKHQQSPGEKDDVDGGHDHGVSLLVPLAILGSDGQIAPPLATKASPATPDPDLLIERAADPPLPRPPSAI